MRRVVTIALLLLSASGFALAEGGVTYRYLDPVTGCDGENASGSSATFQGETWRNSTSSSSWSRCQDGLAVLSVGFEDDAGSANATLFSVDSAESSEARTYETEEGPGQARDETQESSTTRSRQSRGAQADALGQTLAAQEECSVEQTSAFDRESATVEGEEETETSAASASWDGCERSVASDTIRVAFAQGARCESSSYEQAGDAATRTSESSTCRDGVSASAFNVELEAGRRDRYSSSCMGGDGSCMGSQRTEAGVSTRGPLSEEAYVPLLLP